MRLAALPAGRAAGAAAGAAGLCCPGRACGLPSHVASEPSQQAHGLCLYSKGLCRATRAVLSDVVVYLAVPCSIWSNKFHTRSSLLLVMLLSDHAASR